MRFFLKMFRASQASLMGLSLSTYLGRLPKWGSMQSGDIYEHQTLERLIDESDGSAWPTVRATMGSMTAPTSYDKHRLEAWIYVEEQTNWATPTVDDASNITRKSGGFGNNSYLTRQAGSTSAQNRLNPEFVELLMGFPVGWTSLDFPPAPVKHSTPMSRHVQRLARQRRTRGLKRSAILFSRNALSPSSKRFTSGLKKMNKRRLNK